MSAPATFLQSRRKRYAACGDVARVDALYICANDLLYVKNQAGIL